DTVGSCPSEQPSPSSLSSATIISPRTQTSETVDPNGPPCLPFMETKAFVMGDAKEKIAEGSCDENKKMIKSRELEAKKSSSTDAKRESGSSERRQKSDTSERNKTHKVRSADENSELKKEKEKSSTNEGGKPLQDNLIACSEKRTNSKELGNKKVSKLGTVEELGKGTEDVTLEQTLSLPGPEDGKESPVEEKPSLLDLNSNSSAVIDQEGRDSNSSVSEGKDQLFSTSSELRVHSGKDLNCNLILNERAEATKRSHDSERSEHKAKKVKTEKKSSHSSKDKHDKHKTKSSKDRDKRRENEPPGDENKGTSRGHRVLPDIRQEEELKSQGDPTGLQGSPRQERGDCESLQVSSVLNDTKEHAENNKPPEIDGRDSKEGLIDKTPDSLDLNSNSSAFNSKAEILSIPSVLKENELGSKPVALPVKEDYSSISQEGIMSKRPHQDEGKERSEQKAKKSKTEKEKSSHNSKDRHDKKKKEKEKRKEKETIKENKETWRGYSEPPDIKKEEELRSLADYTGSEAVGVQGSLKRERDSEESMETKGRLKDCKVEDENKETLTLNKEGDHDPEHKKEIEKVKEKKSSKKKVKKDKEHRDGHKGEKEGKKRGEEGKERKEKKSKDDSDKSKKGEQKESEKRKISKDGKDKESVKKKSKKEGEEKKSKTEERKEKQLQEEASKWKW
ncbi:DNA ligase 1-like, partial [Acipenser oxyrinchus oxyrinchus]